MGERTIASFTAEQTARFLSGGELGPPHYHDPAVAERMRRQQIALRHAFAACMVVLYDALREDSSQTAQRLRELWNAAERGDPQAKHLLAVMMGELLGQGLTRPA